jgi:hypothetical protein
VISEVLINTDFAQRNQDRLVPVFLVGRPQFKNASIITLFGHQLVATRTSGRARPGVSRRPLRGDLLVAVAFGEHADDASFVRRERLFQLFDGTGRSCGRY